MIRYRIKISEPVFRNSLRRAAVRKLQAHADAVGDILVEQTKARFRDGGDEETRWPDLWVNNDSAVSSVTTDQSERGEAEAFRRAELRKAEKSLTRAIAKGDLKAINKAERQRLDAEKSASTGNPAVRRGGKPLRDSGVLMASITKRIAMTATGAIVRWGSTERYGAYHQSGFSTSGINYIPLTERGRRKPPGVNPTDLGLIRGHDFILLSGVTVPPRPFIRLTDRNRRDIRAAMAGRL